MAAILSPPTQRAKSILVLLPPQAAETNVKTSSNPFDRLGDLSVVVDIVRRILTSDDSVLRLRAEGLQGDFTVTANVDFTRGPIIDVVADAASREAAISDVGLVVNELNKQLAAIQEKQGTNPRFFITSQVIVPATETTTIYSSLLRRLVVSIALGIGLIIGAAILADVVASRSEHRSNRPETSTAESV
jgi:hypothetical protein